MLRVYMAPCNLEIPIIYQRMPNETFSSTPITVNEHRGWEQGEKQENRFNQSQGSLGTCSDGFLARQVHLMQSG
jgi:hypothetical protein